MDKGGFKRVLSTSIYIYTNDLSKKYIDFINFTAISKKNRILRT